MLAAGTWAVRMQGCGIKGCGVQHYRAVGCGLRGCGNVGLWVVRI